MPGSAVSLRRRVLVTAMLLAAAMMPPLAPAGTSSVCGNGVVEGNEECDPGNPLGSMDCNRFCRRIAFEPDDLPYGPRGASPTPERTLPPAIYSPRLQCAPFESREGARFGYPARVRYRVHLCRDAKGKDAFTEQQVRASMTATTAAFAGAGIVLEEEALVRFADDDCNVSMDNAQWEDRLVANTPSGVVAIAFVANIFAVGVQFPVGGYCYFGGPLCANAATFSTLVVHELGHFFGLAHTFECAYGTETAATCAENGDFLCDTPPDRGPSGMKGIGSCEGGSLLNGSCTGTCGSKRCADGSLPDGYNWMSYYDCLPGRFSAEQNDFMHCMLEHEMRAYNVESSTTTTTSSTTTTTLAAGPPCGDSNGDGHLSAADALAALRAGVGLAACPLWVCDFNGSGKVTAADALALLQAAVGMPSTANCPPKPPNA
jgi:cysteine-rich repeat protein